MNKDIRHPFLFTLCGFVLCIMFAGNLAQARETIQVSLDMSGVNDHKMVGYIFIYKHYNDTRSARALKVPQREFGALVVNKNEWVAINLVKLSTIWLCKFGQNNHRMLVRQDGVLDQSTVFVPTKVVANGYSVCELEVLNRNDDTGDKNDKDDDDDELTIEDEE